MRGSLTSAQNSPLIHCDERPAGSAARWQTRDMEAGLRVHEGGSGEPLLVLLHGLGATGDVWAKWRPLLAQRWPGRWLAPDLPGHGGSPPLAAYTFDSFAAAVAGIMPPSTHLTVLGHSLGGVVGLALASGEFEVPVRTVIGLGIKVVWTGEDLDRARAMAGRPPAWFASRDEAAARYLRVSGLAGLLPTADPAVDAGLHEQHGRWRLAMDPGAFAVGVPDMAQLLGRSQAPVTLARGERDPMNTDHQLARLGVSTITLPGLGHNAHVESPELSIALLDAQHRPIGPGSGRPPINIRSAPSD
jgi:pimeloyl-ACP methyl ester carboxylesterase